VISDIEGTRMIFGLYMLVWTLLRPKRPFIVHSDHRVEGKVEVHSYTYLTIYPKVALLPRREDSVPESCLSRPCPCTSTNVQLVTVTSHILGPLSYHIPMLNI